MKSKQSDRIKKLRIQNRMTQAELAKKLNVTPQVVSNWERNYSSIDSDHVQAIALIFNVQSDYILGITDELNIKKTHSNNTNENDLIKLLINNPEITDVQILEQFDFRSLSGSVTEEQVKQIISYARYVLSQK